MKLSLALTKVVEPQCVFAYDVNVLGAKLCVLLGFDEFLARVSAQSGSRLWHEVVYPDRPCRLFVDCEKGLAQGEPAVDLGALVAGVTGAVRQLTGSEEAPLVLVGTRPGKFSVHLVWDLWFEAPAHVRELVRAIPLSASLGIPLDLQVYPCGSAPRTFRMPFSTKMPSNSPLLPLGGPASFDREVFVRGLVGFHQKHSAALPALPSPLRVYGELSPKRQRSLEGSGEVPGPVDRWMRCVYPEYAASSCKVKEDGAYSCVTNFFCEVSGKFHKSNKCYFHGDPLGALVMVCANEECRAPRRLPFTHAQVLASEEEIQLDFELLRILYQ
jgi:hypothetical protein